jgi:Spy/CpxP family protein refolding chaperone
MQRLFSFVIAIIVATALPVLGAAQESPYSGLEQRPIKALSPEEVAGYLEGAGMSLALPAELNGYPGPRHVLDAADSLGLSEGQRQAISAVFDSMRHQAIAVGGQYIRAEQRLDSLFATGAITTENLQQGVAAAENLKAKLRVIHLTAHLETAALLAREQIARYQHLRGYGGAEQDHGAHH